MKKLIAILSLALPLICALVLRHEAEAQSPDPQADWERTLAAAKKEGPVVVGIPASAELRKQIDSRFKEKFGLGVELFPGRGPENVTRIINEYNSGVRYFDILVAGGATPLAMVSAGAADPLEPYMILPEVKDPKSWWGGHIWEDNVSTKRYIYAFQCYTSETFWHNASHVEPHEVGSYDDLLNSKWRGRIGILDPRNPGSGQNTWTFLWKVKGEDYLKKIGRAGSPYQSQSEADCGGAGEREARIHYRP